MREIVSGTVRLTLAGLTLMGLAACSSMGMGGSPPSPAPPPPVAQLPQTAPVASVTIHDVQTALQQNGYYKNQKLDGVWGPRTERAVKAFQRAHGLTSNGQLDVPTLQALNLTGAPPSTGPASAADNTDNNDNNAGVNNPPPAPPPDNGASANVPPNNAPPPPNYPAGSTMPPTGQGTGTNQNH